MPRVVDHAVRRQELAEALWRVVRRDGVHEVSVRTVADEAGTSPGALRHYFGEHARGPFDCVISSVKANIGHTMSAAGVAGLASARLGRTSGEGGEPSGEPQGGVGSAAGRPLPTASAMHKPVWRSLILNAAT